MKKLYAAIIFTSLTFSWFDIWATSNQLLKLELYLKGLPKNDPNSAYHGLARYLRTNAEEDGRAFVLFLIGRLKTKGGPSRLGSGIYEGSVEIPRNFNIQLNLIDLRTLLTEKVCAGDQVAIEIAAAYVTAVETDGAEGETRAILAGYIRDYQTKNLKKVLKKYQTIFKANPLPEGIDAETNKMACKSL